MNVLTRGEENNEAESRGRIHPKDDEEMKRSQQKSPRLVISRKITRQTKEKCVVKMQSYFMITAEQTARENSSIYWTFV